MKHQNTGRSFIGIGGWNRLSLIFLNKHIRKNALLTKLFFGVTVADFDRIHWDFTTLALRNCLLRYIHTGDTVLEMGAGPYAMLSIFLKKRVNCQVSACDINSDYVKHARETASRNNISMDIFPSNLFQSVSNRYNGIFFNAVYIPRRKGMELGIDSLHTYKQDWCGGEYGHETIAQFLGKASQHLYPEGIVLLGYNPAYLKSDIVLGLAEAHRFTIVTVYTSIFIPSKVLVLKKES